jgi:hypothetical protein
MEKDIEDLRRILLSLKEGDASAICMALGDLIELAAGQITAEHAIACMSLAVANFVTLERSREELLEIVRLCHERAVMAQKIIKAENALTCETCKEEMYLYNDTATAVATRVLWCPKCTVDNEYAFVAKMPDSSLALVVMPIDGKGEPRYYREDAIDALTEAFKAAAAEKSAEKEP